MTPKLDHFKNSDSEDDDDYVPPEKPDSDSEQSDMGGEDEVTHAVPEKVDEGAKKREREALWSSFQASVAGPSIARNTDLPTQKMVKIEQKFLFAGNEVIEVVEVPEDSAEAKKWPLWKETTGEVPYVVVESDDLVSSSLHSTSPRTIPVVNPDVNDIMTSVGGTDMLSKPTETIAPTASPSTSSIIDKSAPRRPGPRKSRTSLAPLPGPSKAKKITTLDKSAMDWKNHIRTAGEAGISIQDELEANRRTGGYLEKVDFLKRVEERKEETLESLKSNKRRKL